MTKEEMAEAAFEARRLVAQFDRGALSEQTQGEADIWRQILRQREAWLRGELTISARMIETDSPEEIRRRSYAALKNVMEGAQMYTELQAIGLLRSWKLMNHSPLRKIEKDWLAKFFSGQERISRQRFFIPYDLGEATAEEMGGHKNQYGQYFRCRHCPDSYTRRKR